VASTINADGVTPLTEDIGERVGRHLRPRGILEIAWDVAPAETVDERCLVFEESVGAPPP